MFHGKKSPISTRAQAPNRAPTESAAAIGRPGGYDQHPGDSNRIFMVLMDYPWNIMDKRFS